MKCFLNALCSLGAIAIVTGAAHAAQRISVGDHFSGQIVIGARKIPLPEGRWKVTYSKRRYGGQVYGSGMGPTFQSVRLINEIEQINPYLVLVNASIEMGSSSGFVASRYCARRDLLFKKLISNIGGGKQECWGVERRRGGLHRVHFHFADEQGILGVTHVFRYEPELLEKLKTWGREWFPKLRRSFK